MRLVWLFPFVLLVFLFSACTRAHVTTEVKVGGSWTRTVALSGQQKKEGQPNFGSIDDSFVLPSGPGWKSREEKKGDERTLTFERVLTMGATSKGDVSIKGGDAGGTQLVNEVTVNRLAPRRFEYRETLRWTGPALKAKVTPEDLAKVKAALPAALATDEAANGLSQKVYVLAVPMVFGPGDPIMAIGLTHPDLAVLRLRQRMGSLVMKALEEQFGDKLTLAERREAARKIIETTFTQAMPAKPDTSNGPPNSGSGLVPLTFIYKGLGKVVSSNGEVDDLTGEVFWCLFPEAASLEPVKLTAVIQLDPQ
jgi:hypothetical protein